MTIFAELGLNATILENIKRSGYKTPTDIQQKSIGAVLSGADTYAIAPTGTGKTAAYLLPLLQELSRADHSGDQVRPIRALILVPTRELAQQVEESIANYGKNLKLRTITLFGGIRIESQVKRFKRGADIIVSTPKRLLDLLKVKAFSFDNIQHFVMDEADRLVSMGIQRELDAILAALPKQKQVIFFSATDLSALTKFSQDNQSNKKLIKTDAAQPALDKIVHTMYRCSREDKNKCLFGLLDMLDCEKALIFARTKNDVDILTRRLNERGFASQGIHNEIPQRKRQERLSGFKNKEFKFLVATDIASRGLDIDELYYVINYDLPVNSNDYIHRVGRTARTNSTTNLSATQSSAKQSPSKQASSKSGASNKWASNKESRQPVSKRSASIAPYASAYANRVVVTDVLGHAFSLVSPEQERLVDRIVKVVGKHIMLERNPFAR